jgi:RNA polymerase sigma-70 factor (ECF subfamily)
LDWVTAISEPSMQAERELIAGCQRGDQACWQRLIQIHREDAWRILARLLGPDSELEDLVQKVFIKVHRSLGRFEGRSRFTTWLYRICVHVAMDHLRHKRRSREVPDPDTVAAQADPGADPSDALVQRQAAERLNRALAHIKEAKRNVLVLHDLMEVPAEEIALSLGIPAATVRTRLFHGRRELARHLARQAAKDTP